MKNRLIFFLCLVSTFWIGTMQGQTSEGHEAPPPNYIETASSTEVDEKIQISYNHAINIFEAIRSNSNEGISDLLPTPEDAHTFITVAHWKDRRMKNQLLKDSEGWQIDLLNRLNDSFENVRNEASKQGFDWNSAEIVEIDNPFKRNSQFAGGSVKIYTKDAQNNKYTIRVSSLFEIEGKWLMLNHLLSK